MDRLNESEELGSGNEADGFAGGKIPGVAGEGAGGDDDGLGGLCGRHEAEHFADDGGADGEDFPLFALDEAGEPVFAQGQVHAAIGTPAQGVFDLVGLSAIRLGNEVFEVFPGGLPELVETGLLVNKTVAFFGKEEGADGEDAKEQQWQGSQRNDPFGQYLAGVVLSSPYRDAPAQAGKRSDAERGTDPPGEF